MERVEAQPASKAHTARTRIEVQVFMVFLMVGVGGLHFLSPHPGPLPWGEGESCAVSEQYPRQSLASECAQNTRPAEAVPSPRGRGSGWGQGEGERSVAILLLRLPSGQGWS